MNEFFVPNKLTDTIWELLFWQLFSRISFDTKDSNVWFHRLESSIVSSCEQRHWFHFVGGTRIICLNYLDRLILRASRIAMTSGTEQFPRTAASAGLVPAPSPRASLPDPFTFQFWPDKNLRHGNNVMNTDTRFLFPSPSRQVIALFRRQLRVNSRLILTCLYSKIIESRFTFSMKQRPGRPRTNWVDLFLWNA